MKTLPALHDTRRVIADPRLWISSFGIATLLGLIMALQAWLSFEATKRPSSFWQSRFLEPQLIPWWVWALLTPLLVVIVQHVHRPRPLWRTVALYAVLGAATIVVQAIATGFALGWWWSFPSLIPTDPQWHIAHQLRSRTVFGVFVFALIAVAARRSQVVRPEPQSAPPTPAAPPPPAHLVTPSAIALRTKDRVLLVKPEQIIWAQADRDHVIVHLKEASHRIRETLTTFESRLPADQLVRVSRSAIVNITEIAEMQTGLRGNYLIILRAGTRVPTGSKYRDRIARLL